jgi:hypothetical protein
MKRLLLISLTLLSFQVHADQKKIHLATRDICEAAQAKLDTYDKQFFPHEIGLYYINDDVAYHFERGCYDYGERYLIAEPVSDVQERVRQHNLAYKAKDEMVEQLLNHSGF